MKLFITVKNNWYKLISFMVLFIGTIVYFYFRNIDMAIGDAEYYLNIADACFPHSGFRISLFPKTFRGCLFPFYLELLKHSFLGIRLGWAMTGGIIMGMLFSVIFPSFFESACKSGPIKYAVGTIVGFVFLYIHGDTVIYTLSDMPATFALVLGVWMLLLIVNTLSYRKTIVLSIIAGIFFYASYNTRAAYLYGVIVAIIVFVIASIRSPKKMVTAISVILLGCILATLPQCYINQVNGQGFSPRIYTENIAMLSSDEENQSDTDDSAPSLQAQQVIWGMSLDRYETYVGEQEEYSDHRVMFYDTSSQAIINRANVSEDSGGISNWFCMFLQYPLDMLGAYTRHLVSAMTPSWNKVYIKEINTNMSRYILISVAIWTLFLMGLLFLKKEEIKQQRLLFGFMFAIFVPAFLQAMGAVEIRYFLPGYLMGYGYVAYGIQYKELWIRVKRNLPRVIIIFLIIFALWISTIGNVLSNNEKGVLLIQNRTTNSK